MMCSPTCDGISLALASFTEQQIFETTYRLAAMDQVLVQLEMFDGQETEGYNRC